MAAVRKRTVGVLDDQMIDPELVNVDVRPVGRRITDWLRKPQNVISTMMMLTGAAWVYPQVGAWLVVLMIGLTFWALAQKETAPLKMPVQAGLMDPHQLNPSTSRPSAGQGIFFLGNDIRSGKEVWLTNDDCRQHFLVLGTTGSGKTEALLGFAANALSWGSGFLFCDGKGDVSLFAKVYALARRFGREDDLLVLNFMTGNKDLNSGGEILSNTLNPFSTGSSDGLTQMVVSLMDDVGGDGAMWKGRATAMLTGVMRAMCWLRDQGYLDLNVAEIRDHIDLKRIIELGDENKYPDLPPSIRKSVRSYLTSLPGYQEEKKDKQPQTTLDQHGYLQMQFTKILSSLADVYGHIFSTPYGEVDMYDVVLGRRLLVIMLPALEKSGDEIANLGKIVVATLKGMMGSTLGSKLEGNWKDVVENRPTNSPSPFLCILDEVGYYTVDGMALMAAQARSLGFAMVYASQDLPAMKRTNEKEAAPIIANTSTKIFMKTEEPNETAKLAIDRGDKALRTRAASFDRKTSEAGNYAVEANSATFEEANRISLTDLTRQMSGEMHIIHADLIVRARSFYVQPEVALNKDLLHLRANYFVKVPRPSLDEIAVSTRGPDIMERLAGPDTPRKLKADADAAVAAIQAAAEAGDEIAMAARTFDRVTRAGRKPIEAACAAVADVMRLLRGAVASFAEDVHGTYAAGAPPVQGGFAIADPDDDGFGGGFPGGGDPEGGHHGGRTGAHPGEDFGDGFADPFMADRGVPLSDAPLPPRPARPFAPAARRPQRVDPGIRHGATVDGGPLIDMADRIASNDAIMNSLAALDFNGDQITSQEVDSAIEKAVGGAVARGGPPDGVPGRVEAFDRAASTIGAARPAAGSGAHPQHEEDDDDGEGSGQFVSDFLEGLLSDKDGDD